MPAPTLAVVTCTLEELVGWDSFACTAIFHVSVPEEHNLMYTFFRCCNLFLLCCMRKPAWHNLIYIVKRWHL